MRVPDRAGKEEPFTKGDRPAALDTVSINQRLD